MHSCPNEAYPEITISARHERRMKALFARYKRKRIVRYIAKYTGKVATILLMMLGVAFSAMLLNPQVRGAVQSLIINVYEKFTRFDFQGDSGDTITSLERWSPEWLPKGFALETESQFANHTRQIYANQDGDTIMLLISIDDSSFAATDNEQRVYETRIINKVVFYCGYSELDTRENQVLWMIGNTKFVIDSTVDINDLVAMAQSIKK